MSDEDQPDLIETRIIRCDHTTGYHIDSRTIGYSENGLEREHPNVTGLEICYPESIEDDEGVSSYEIVYMACDCARALMSKMANKINLLEQEKFRLHSQSAARGELIKKMNREMYPDLFAPGDGVK